MKGRPTYAGALVTLHHKGSKKAGVVVAVTPYYVWARPAGKPNLIAFASVYTRRRDGRFVAWGERMKGGDFVSFEQ